VDNHSLVLEPPEIHPICPSRTLKARLVVIKGFQEPESFIGVSSLDKQGNDDLTEPKSGDS